MDTTPAPLQSLAHVIRSKNAGPTLLAQLPLLHHGFAGRVNMVGNIAFAFTPSELDDAMADRFVRYHLMHDAPMHDIFRIRTTEVDGTRVH